MTPYDQVVQAISCKFHDRIKAYCASLFNLLNLSHFWHFRITNNGYFSIIGSHVGWSEFFAAEKFYLNYPYFRHPMHFQNGINIMGSVMDESLLKLLGAAKGKFNLNHSLLLISKTSDGLEASGFSSPCLDEMQKMLMLNELPLLRLFIKKFQEENRSLFSCMEDNQINLVELIGSNFYEKSAAAMPIPHPSAKQIFLGQLGIKIGKPLTFRETEVIRLLLRGYSASRIGKQVFLSPRTVEHHVERMKDKLGCDSKAELIQKARELEYFGYF